MTRTVQTNNAR